MKADDQQTISESEQESTDFDWFAVDEIGCIGHFTTAGFKLLPRSVASSAEDLKKLTDYFKKLVSTGVRYHVSNDLETEVGPFEREAKREQYLAGFVGMAGRGLYSFDIHTYVRPGLAYFCVATPIQPLYVESLPKEIRTIIERTQLKGIRLSEASR